MVVVPEKIQVPVPPPLTQSHLPEWAYQSSAINHDHVPRPPVLILDIDPEDLLAREVYAQFGLAIYTSQVLEHGLSTLVVWLGRCDGRCRAYKDTEAANVDLLRKTMGSVKEAHLERRPDIEHLDRHLVRAIRLRNFLAHEYFCERAAAFMTEGGRKQMIAEWKKAVAFFHEVDATLEPLASHFAASDGRLSASHATIHVYPGC